MGSGRWQQAQQPGTVGAAKCVRHHSASPWASACRKDGRDAEAGEGRDATATTGQGHQHGGSLQRDVPCWPWLSGVAEGRKEGCYCRCQGHAWEQERQISG